MPNLKYFRGDDVPINIEVTKDGVPQNIAGWKAYLTLKKDPDVSDDDADLKKDVTTHTDPTNGKTQFLLTFYETDLLLGVYHFDIQLKNESTWGVNLVVNGGFPSDTVGWTPVDCTLASIAGGQAGNCLEITRVAESEQSASQAITVGPGKTYKLEGYVKSGTSGNENFKFAIQDTTHSTWIHNVTDGQSSGDWVKHSYEFRAPDGCVLITVQLVKESVTAGTMLFDEITLQEDETSEIMTVLKGLMEFVADITRRTT